MCSVARIVSRLHRDMPSMAATHGGILYYVVKVPKDMR